MTTFDFLEPLEDIIIEQFEVLNADYAMDMARDVTKSLSIAIERESEVRYVLIDRDTGQLESRVLYEEYEEARKAIQLATLEGCVIATLIVEQ